MVLIWNQKIPPLASKQLEPLLISIGDIRPHPENYKNSST